MKEHPTETTCPLAAVDRRLADAHRLWHQAEAAYFNPDEFRLAIQSAIQVLRSVTFILQNHKGIIPDFDQWYGNYVSEKQGKRGKWQERLYTDSLMRWLVEARNKIEKQGDLEAHSFLRAEILGSYLDEGPRIEVQVNLFESAEALFRSIPDNLTGEHLRRNGALRIQRRWVENSLQDYELLDAVAIAYGKIVELVHDAHRQIGLDPPQTIHGDQGESYDLPAMGWRFPCMIGHDAPRMLTMSLADGSPIEFETKNVTVEFDTTKVAALLEHYGGNPFEAIGRDYDTDAALAAGYFAMVRAIFLRDRHHISLLILIRNRKPITMIELKLENVQQKYVLMRQLADEVTKTGADAAMLISEVWQARADQLKLYERPADSPVRTESLTLQFVGKTGEPIDFLAEINREGETVSLGDSQISEATAAFNFAPFYQAWGRTVPQDWIDTSRVIMAKQRSG